MGNENGAYFCIQLYLLLKMLNFIEIILRSNRFCSTNNE